MRKKIILVTTAFLLTAGAYFLLSYGDRSSNSEKSHRDPTEAVRRFVSRPTSQKTQTISDSELTFSPGETTVVRVYDDVTGRKKYQFTAKTWEPIGDEEFHVTDLRIQIFMPRGEITYISADEADITVARKSRGVEAQRGTLTGNVEVIIDRTSDEWRAANPALAARDAHPDDLIRIDMESARFDMDRAELFSDGAVTVDSREARIDDVNHLMVQWDQIDNRIEVLRFKQGGRMVLRTGTDLVSFSLPGSEQKKPEKRAVDANRPEAMAMAGNSAKIPKARANEPLSIGTMSADEAAGEIRFEGGHVAANRPISLSSSDQPVAANATGGGGSGLRPTEVVIEEMEVMKSEARSGVALVKADDLARSERKKIHTYRAVFSNEVVVQQVKGGVADGELQAQQLEVHFDFGSRQRRMVTGEPSVAANRPAQRLPRAGADKNKVVIPSTPVEDDDENEEIQTEIILTWNGPLEIRPIPAEPARQTGKRFDVIATGMPIKIKSEQGDAVCEQLVFRNERRQAWLSGSEQFPAELSVGEARKLSGREIFFDQKRGLAHVEGAGHMTDSRTRGAAGVLGRARPWSSDKVNIRWSQSVDLEIGKRTIRSVNPETGVLEEKEKEYLRRAWFHGDVYFERGDEELNADEVAATFFYPKSDDAVADHIEFLNMEGNVRLIRDNELIQAALLDVEMIVSPEGRNLPRLIEAVGDILVQDPKHNLKISRAESMTAIIRDGNELTRASIVSSDPSILARARHKDMAIHGHRIEIDMDRQAMDVPGPGKSWMVTRKSFGGQRLKKPTVVKTTWSGKMQLRLEQDYGVFLDDVHCTSDGFALNSDKLTIRFTEAPAQTEQKKSKPDFLDRFSLGAIIGDRAELERSDPLTVTLDQKRPTYIVAEGNAEVINSNHAPETPEGEEGRLLSRISIVGHQIVADLEREQMSVPCQGKLLIEDYQFDELGASRRRLSSPRVSGPLMSSMRSEGPSQTFVGWENSMDFFVDRALVVFDRNVTMTHRSGKQMVKKKELAAAMKLDESALDHLGAGRRAKLTCGNLLLEFRNATSSKSGTDVRATDLERLIARRAVHLKEGTKSLMGEYLQYLNDTNEIRLEGSGTTQARLFDEDESSQRLGMLRAPLVIWNRKTNKIDAPGATIRTSSR
ncbi:MAG: LPS export ABC transporter periplasmic protein LptC [Phycisphaerales bacterium]|nr:LPS export ABC transporter periplasmic protein LptC [Phycisphaerales bacterium]